MLTAVELSEEKNRRSMSSIITAQHKSVEELDCMSNERFSLAKDSQILGPSENSISSMKVGLLPDSKTPARTRFRPRSGSGARINDSNNSLERKTFNSFRGNAESKRCLTSHRISRTSIHSKYKKSKPTTNSHKNLLEKPQIFQGDGEIMDAYGIDMAGY